jgi:glycosyltransferase involved in cell wall biosynthesis
VSGAVPSIEVLYLTHNYPRYAGDFAGAFIARLAEKVTATGRPVGVLAPHCREALLSEAVNGVPVWRFRYASDARETLAYQGDLGKVQIAGRRSLFAHSRFMCAFRREAMAVTARESPRTIHAHWWIPAGLIARSLRFSGNLIVTLHGTDLRLLRDRRWLRPLARRVFARASVVTVVSSWLGSALREMLPETAAKLEVVPMPLNDDVFFHDASLSLARDVPLLVSVTRFTEQKRNHVLLRALALLRERGIAFNARLIGEGPLRPEIIRQIGSFGLEDRVTLMNPVSQTELAAQYREADLVVLPAVDEGFGMALVEAQLCGTAVAGVRSGGLCDIIDDGATGILAQPDDAPDLARALQQLLRDGALRARLADAGRRAATQRFSSAAIVGRFCQWYDSGRNG